MDNGAIPQLFGNRQGSGLLTGYEDEATRTDSVPEAPPRRYGSS
jgi:hypothetical protein